VRHYINITAGQPWITWLNASTSSALVTYEFDGLCDITVTKSVAQHLKVDLIISNTQINLTISKNVPLAPGLYTVWVDAFHMNRDFNGVTREVFVGNYISNFQVCMNMFAFFFIQYMAYVVF